MSKKYELTNETIEYRGIVLHRIISLIDFNDIKKGDIGGFIEKEDNLSQYGYCWIYNDARICGNAKVYDNAMVYDNARVFGNARVYGNAKVFGNAAVCDDSVVCGNAEIFNNVRVYCNAIVCGDARVYGNAIISNNAYILSNKDYLCIGPMGSRDDYTTFYLDKNRNIYVKCGCFCDTIDKFKDKVIEVHKDNKYAKEYLSSISFAKDIFNTI